MAAIQAIHIRGHEERPEPKPHTVYRIEIHASVRSWTMWRRYSEFVDLHTELTKSIGTAPPEALPPKHPFSLRRSKDPKILEERVRGLESYLRAILSSKDDRWRESFSFKDFLGVPVGKYGGGDGAPSSFTSSSWLDEHSDLQSLIRDIRADINRRDVLSERGDVTASHSANVQAKKKLAGVLNRVSLLTKGLEPLAQSGMAQGELQRRTDMVARLQDDCERLSKIVIVARQTNRGLASARSEQTASADKAALFESSSTSQRPVARVFGKPPAPKETDVTRPLDDQGLLQLQQTQVDQQDSQLSQLSAILARQKQLGLAISNELVEQEELLDNLLDDVDRVGGKLSSAKKQLNRLG